MATSARQAAPAPATARARPRPAPAVARRGAARQRAEAAAPLDEAKAAVEPAAAAVPAPRKPRPDGAAEPKKLKLVRDSFTLPKVEYGVIGVLKTRSARLGLPSKKSEIVRAGIKALAEMDDAQFLACVSALPKAKPPRSKA